MDDIAIDVNYLWLDLRVTETEDSIITMQQEIKTHQISVTELKCNASYMEDRHEVARGRSLRNNIRLIGFPERAEGSSAELFLKKRIVNKKLPNFFSIEHT
ncbi:hypothetical protein NDU88_001588 [Pleurodeles waltl]|uniref:Uncharacterized protein n=1 Tax=Pleurodeles waltl TaxID=8319 RepID=A0AAV7LZ09_PLEWA|nr:hypothetical protein NDU88_001588 [Pleurodeles waltl]